MDYPIRTLQQLRPLLMGLRKQTGMSQAVVAELLGVTQQSYAKIEANPASTSVERLYTILRLLNGELTIRETVQPGSKGDLFVLHSFTPARNSERIAQLKIRRKATANQAPPKVMPESKKKEQW